MLRKVLCIFMCALTALGCCSLAASASDESLYVRKREDITVRDPYILVDNGKYYMYGTCLASGLGYGCCYSEDLENWTVSQNVFSAPADFDGTQCFWAPECHFYNGSYWLFATYYSKTTEHRGVSIFKASSPLGPFSEVGSGHLTPSTWDAIDGTLYVDDDGQPWMVFIYEWTCAPNENGGIAAAKLSSDFTEFISEPTVLFYADDALWTTNGVTDGPFLYKTSSGRLSMLWSSGNPNGYAVGTAYSVNGKVDGQWKLGKTPLYRKSLMHKFDGGHAMLFTALDGRTMMGIHSPNWSKDGIHETAEFLPVKDIGNEIILDEGRFPMLTKYADIVLFFFSKLKYDIEHIF